MPFELQRSRDFESKGFDPLYTLRFFMSLVYGILINTDALSSSFGGSDIIKKLIALLSEYIT